MKVSPYRLAHFKVSENIDGSLWWESYTGFARTKSGRCFIESNVLFFEPAIDVSEPGFLMMEYNEALDALPLWTKTQYYCTTYTLRSCCRDERIFFNKRNDSGFRKRVEEDAISPRGDFEMKRILGCVEMDASVYRLGRYKIIETGSGVLRWHTCTHLNRLKIGKGFIEGKILFVDGKTIDEPEFSKIDFFNRLNKLPKWEKTHYYCTNYTLKPCHKIDARRRKQNARPFNAYLRQAKNRIITDKKPRKKSVFKKIVGIMKQISTYKNRFLKGI